MILINLKYSLLLITQVLDLSQSRITSSSNSYVRGMSPYNKDNQCLNSVKNYDDWSW